MTHLIERKYHAHFLTPKRMTVSLAKASLCRREAREMEKRECAEDDGKGKERREAPNFSLFPSSPTRFAFFDHRIYSINRSITFSPFSARVVRLFCNKTQTCNKARFL